MTIILPFILLFSLNNNPPGTIKVKNYYVDRTEIQNVHWLEYIYHRGKEMDSGEMQKILPDSANVWYSLEENRYQPIVLITYDQAVEYCVWRSKVVSEKLGKKITYRLPTVAEWRDIAEKIIKTDLKQVEKELQKAEELIKKDSGQYVLMGKEKPGSRIYNMFDNVTEMTLKKGIAIGANNQQLTDPKTNLTRLVKYNSPNSYLGFRCIAEME
jgi:formylglycine-generating enzyme required for sulfatase activity